MQATNSSVRELQMLVQQETGLLVDRQRISIEGEHTVLLGSWSVAQISVWVCHSSNVFVHSCHAVLFITAVVHPL